MKKVICIIAILLASCGPADLDVVEDESSPVETESEVLEAVEVDPDEVTVLDDDDSSGDDDDCAVPEDTAEEEAPNTTIGFIETSGCDWAIGAHACDFQLLDQNGDFWRLSEQLGDLVLLDLSAMWCGPCNVAAATVEEVHTRYQSQGFQYVTVLIADAQNDTVEDTDINEWTSRHSILTAPVLMGDRNLLESSGISHGFPVTSWPTFILIDRTGDVAFGLRGYNEEWIVQEIEANL